MKRLSICLVILFGLVTLASATAGVQDHPRIQQARDLLQVWLDAQHDYEQIPGCALSVVSDQVTLWSYATGVMDREGETPVTPNTVFSICSISKLFTSIAVLQLRDAGKLRLDDPVSKYLPWFMLKQTFPAHGPVTVEGLLSHASGLPRESDYPYWSYPEFDFPSRVEVIEQLSEQETLYPAFSTFQYSNLGLTLAGYIVEEVSGQSFADYVQDHILDPLDLEDTRPRMPQPGEDIPIATGYSSVTRTGDRLKLKPFQANGITPAAGFSSTVKDLARFASWQFRLLNTHETEVLEANTLREMQRVHWLDQDWEFARGLGFSIMRYDGKTFVGHGGSCPGHRSQLLLHIPDKIATVFMANASGVNSGLYARRAYEIMAPALKAARDSTREAAALQVDWEKYLGSYSMTPWGGEIAVIAWNGELGMLSLPTDHPVSGITRLEHVEGNTFRRVREDALKGETIVFETDASGRVTHMRHHSNLWPRMD